ncbi:MAG: TatD family nuclease-associated radical SAM protein [Candidatus Bathyarchaeia archaeon]
MKNSPAIAYWLGANPSLYLNITNRCSNDCYFCFRNFAKGVGGFNLRLQKEPSVEEVTKELQRFINLKPWREVVFCGFGEPLERLDCLLGVARWVKKYHGTPVRVDTNGHGYLLNPGREVIRELKGAGVDRVSVSLNAHDEKTYNRVCRPKFEGAYENVLRFIQEASKELDTEVTAVDIPEMDLPKVEEMARKMGARFRRREYLPPSR